MKRWQHRISLVFFIEENDLYKMGKVIDEYRKYNRITFILYIVNHRKESSWQSIYYDISHPVVSNETIFPINILRDLAIEFIDTTHYFVSDIDVFSSDTLYDTLIKHKDVLKDPKAVLLLQTFITNKNAINLNNCFNKGVCKDMYNE